VVLILQMFFYTKCMVALSVFVTMLCGVLVDQCVAYFPIEISRTASGRIASIVFPVGAFFSFCVAMMENTESHWKLSPFVGFLLLALVSDKVNWPLHMLGVFAMVFPIALRCQESFQFAALFVSLLGLYFGRLVIKGATVMHYSNPVATAKAFMFGTPFDNQLQLLAFQMGGVLQWAFLWGIMQLHTI
jgi:hypothetical protein